MSTPQQGLSVNLIIIGSVYIIKSVTINQPISCLGYSQWDSFINQNDNVAQREYNS